MAMIGVDARYIPVDADSVVADKDGFVLIDDDSNHMRPLEKASYQLSGKRALEPVEEDVWDTRFKPALRKQAELAVLTASGQQTELATLQDALSSMRLTQAIYS